MRTNLGNPQEKRIGKGHRTSEEQHYLAWKARSGLSRDKVSAGTNGARTPVIWKTKPTAPEQTINPAPTIIATVPFITMRNIVFEIYSHFNLRGVRLRSAGPAAHCNVAGEVVDSGDPAHNWIGG